MGDWHCVDRDSDRIDVRWFRVDGSCDSTLNTYADISLHHGRDSTILLQRHILPYFNATDVDAASGVGLALNSPRENC